MLLKYTPTAECNLLDNYRARDFGGAAYFFRQMFFTDISNIRDDFSNKYAEPFF